MHINLVQTQAIQTSHLNPKNKQLRSDNLRTLFSNITEARLNRIPGLGKESGTVWERLAKAYTAAYNADAQANSTEARQKVFQAVSQLFSSNKEQKAVAVFFKRLDAAFEHRIRDHVQTQSLEALATTFQLTEVLEALGRFFLKNPLLWVLALPIVLGQTLGQTCDYHPDTTVAPTDAPTLRPTQFFRGTTSPVSQPMACYCTGYIMSPGPVPIPYTYPAGTTSQGVPCCDPYVTIDGDSVFLVGAMISSCNSPSPSLFPTVSSRPTLYPSLRPSGRPSLSPSTKPTPAPTLNPTLAPTFDPTQRPSRAPSLRTTSNPTDVRTDSPTGIPYPDNDEAPVKNDAEPDTKGVQGVIIVMATLLGSVVLFSGLYGAWRFRNGGAQEGVQPIPATDLGTEFTGPSSGIPTAEVVPDGTVSGTVSPRSAGIPTAHRLYPFFSYRMPTAQAAYPPFTQIDMVEIRPQDDVNGSVLGG